LPDFADPPVTEAVLGIELSPVQGWSIPHYGLLWAKVKDRYPHFEVHPPLQPSVGSEGQLVRRILVQVTAVPAVRCWFLEEGASHLMQVQSDRLIHNWRKRQPGDKYPRYESLRAALAEDWRVLVEFCQENGLGAPQVEACEVTYVNHIPRGSGWERPADIPEIIPAWTGSLIAGGPRSVALDLTYGLQDVEGRLRVHFEPSQQWDALQLTLTAQGAPGSTEFDGALAWLDQARAQAVHAFADFTSTKMHQLWQRKDPA